MFPRFMILCSHTSGYGGSNISTSLARFLPDILSCCEVRVSARDRYNPTILHDAATRACKTYLDRFAARQERET